MTEKLDDKRAAIAWRGPDTRHYSDVQFVLLLNHHPSSCNTTIMSWRNQGITGSNNIPLGSRRRFGGEDDGGSFEDGFAQEQPDVSLKRGRSPVRGWPSHNQPKSSSHTNSYLQELNPDGTKKRKKRNRWGDATDNKAAGLMNLPTAVLGNMTSEQLDAYTLHLRIEEISQKLRINDVVPADGDR